MITSGLMPGVAMCEPTPVDREHPEGEQDPALELRDPADVLDAADQDADLHLAAGGLDLGARRRARAIHAHHEAASARRRRRAASPARRVPRIRPRARSAAASTVAPSREAREVADVHDLGDRRGRAAGSRASGCAAPAASGRPRNAGAAVPSALALPLHAAGRGLAVPAAGAAPDALGAVPRPGARRESLQHQRLLHLHEVPHRADHAAHRGRVLERHRPRAGAGGRARAASRAGGGRSRSPLFTWVTRRVFLLTTPVPARRGAPRDRAACAAPASSRARRCGDCSCRASS